MAERDITSYEVTTTNTSTGLGDTSYPTVEADLTQDFGMQRVSRGIDTVNLRVQYKDSSGEFIDPDSNNVIIQIYDVFLNEIINSTETREATGKYLYAYTPPASAALGIYKAVHTASISGSGIVTEDFFKIVSTNPGSYYGKFLRGEDIVTATLSDEALQAIDVGSSVTVVIKSPTGAIVSQGLAVSGAYNYSPGYNDYEGDFQVLFYTVINGSQQIEKQFFSVVARREENLVSVEEFKSSLNTIRFKKQLNQLTDPQIDDLLADAQADASQYVQYPIGNKLISGEKTAVSNDEKGFLYLRPKAKNITKLVRCILRYHPQVSITLPVSGFLVDNDTGVIKYVYSSGMIIPGSIHGLINEYSFESWYEAIIDYEVGFVRDEKIKIKRAIRLLAVDMIQQGYGLYDVKEVKSGNYTEQYFDPLRAAGSRVGYDGNSPLQKEAFRILQYFQRAPIV